MAKEVLLRVMWLVLAVALAGHFVADVVCQADAVGSSVQCNSGTRASASPGDLTTGHLHAGVTLPVGANLAIPFGLSFVLLTAGYTQRACTLCPPIHPPKSIHLA